jgi:hypothetical protein
MVTEPAILDKIWRAPGVTAVGLLREGGLEVVKGQFVVDVNRLYVVLMRNLDRLKEYERVLSQLSPLRGFIMVLDDVGFMVLDQLVVQTDARKSDWDQLVRVVRP